MRGKLNEQRFPRQVVIQLPNLNYNMSHIIGEPKYKYGQQEHVTVKNHNRSISLSSNNLFLLGSAGETICSSCTDVSDILYLSFICKTRCAISRASFSFFFSARRNASPGEGFSCLGQNVETIPD